MRGLAAQSHIALTAAVQGNIQHIAGFLARLLQTDSRPSYPRRGDTEGLRTYVRRDRRADEGAVMKLRPNRIPGPDVIAS